MIVLLLDGFGWVFVVAGWFVVLTHRPMRSAAGLFTAANGLFAMADVVAGDRFSACLSSAFCAVCAWLWWRHGGGGGTRRRLRSLAKRFRGVRRTAPVYGGAS